MKCQIESEDIDINFIDNKRGVFNARASSSRQGENFEDVNISTMRGTLDSIDKRDKDAMVIEEIRGSGSMAFKKRADEGFYNFTDPTFHEELSQIQEEAEFNNIKEIAGPNFTYYGEAEFSERTGFGICNYFDGSKYTGEWKNNKQNGLGKLITVNGELYEGDFKNNKPEGYILFTTKDNVKYEGLMKNYTYLANTALLVTTRSQVIEIVLEKDFDTRTDTKCFEGLGKIIGSDKSHYEGFVKDLSQDNLGILKKDNMMFKGMKRSKQYNGYCEICYKDGTRYFGYLQNNKKDGFGIFLSKDCLLNVANYKENCKDGASITRKYDSAINNEIFVYENFHHGFRSNKLEGRQVIENYIQNFYPEQMPLLKIDFNSLVNLLDV